MIYDVTANEKDREIRLILSKTKATICIKKIMAIKFLVKKNCQVLVQIIVSHFKQKVLSQNIVRFPKCLQYLDFSCSTMMKQNDTIKKDGCGEIKD